MCVNHCTTHQLILLVHQGPYGAGVSDGVSKLHSLVHVVQSSSLVVRLVSVVLQLLCLKYDILYLSEENTLQSTVSSCNTMHVHARYTFK